MTQARRDQAPRSRRVGVWGWLFGITFGTAFRFIGWTMLAITISILIEWIGMIWFWGPEHSRTILEIEMGYLSNYNRNLLLGFYPSDLGVMFVSAADTVVSFLRLDAMSQYLASSAAQTAYYGVSAIINTVFIFAVRGAICVSAITGFVLVALVAFIDGLVERDIRKASGGIESAMLYHRSKRMIVPILLLSFGGYLTAPVSVHPTLVFLPVMGLLAVVIFIAAKTFKKYL